MNCTSHEYWRPRNLPESEIFLGLNRFTDSIASASWEEDDWRIAASVGESPERLISCPLGELVRTWMSSSQDEPFRTVCGGWLFGGGGGICSNGEAWDCFRAQLFPSFTRLTDERELESTDGANVVWNGCELCINKQIEGQ